MCRTIKCLKFRSKYFFSYTYEAAIYTRLYVKKFNEFDIFSITSHGSIN